jgi:hypothetical protein
MGEMQYGFINFNKECYANHNKLLKSFFLISKLQGLIQMTRNQSYKWDIYSNKI